MPHPVTLLALPVALGSLALAATVAAAPEGRGSGPASPAPVTHDVRMVLEGTTYKFVPATVSAKSGDRLRFVLETGAPHNVAFDPEQIPDDLEPTLSANMSDQMSPLAGPLLTKPGDIYIISLQGVKPGVYPFFCMPHVAMEMKGPVTVK
jgi:plastocyanin